MQELVKGFEEEQPGIEVKVQQIPWTAAHEKLLTAYVGDATPDLAQLGNSWIAEFRSSAPSPHSTAWCRTPARWTPRPTSTASG
jgi:multiple sugar transport system substrate-binding protein